MTKTRRDVLKFAGGSALGLMFTPAPWRLITDTALWSENWPGVPRPVRGEISQKRTYCALCPAGCAVRARCVAGQPVAMAGVSGGLCPFGVTAHHLPYHPDRLREGLATQAAAAVKEAITQCKPGERVAVLDLRPGRTASWTYRRAMARIANGTYIAPPEPQVSVDLSAARTVLSIGAPVLERWASPAAVWAIRDRLRVIQADPIESPTASLADRWLPIRAGSEAALAQGLAGLQGAAETARLTGLPESEISALSAEIAANGPSLVVDRSMSAAVVDLNVRLGGWGRTIGLRPQAPVPARWKQEAAPVTSLSSVPDGSVRVLLIDESVAGDHVSWDAISSKLVGDHPVVVTLACSRKGFAPHATYALPAPVYPETLDDLPQPIDSLAAAYRLVVPLVAPPAGVVNPVAFVAGTAGLTDGDALRERADAIHEVGLGVLGDAPIKGMSPEDFWKGLNAGARWLGQAEKSAAPSRANLQAPTAQAPGGFTVIANSSSPALLSPLMSKVHRESNLLLAPDCIALNPSDAASAGLSEGCRAILESPAGRYQVQITTDSGVQPGVVLAADPGMAGTTAKVVRA